MLFHRSQAVILAALTIVLAGFMTGDALLLQALISCVEQANWQRFALMVVIIIIYLIIQAFVYFARQAYGERYANAVLNTLRTRIFTTICHTSLSTYHQTGANRYLAQLTSQLDSVKANLIDVLIWGGYLICQLLFATAAILIINPTLGLVALALCIPLSLTPILSKRMVERARKALVATTTHLNETSADLLHGMPDVRLGGSVPPATSRFKQTLISWQRDANHDACVQKGVDALNDSLSHLLIFGVWIVGGMLIMKQHMSVSQIVAFATLTGNISVPLFFASGLVAQYHAGKETWNAIQNTVGMTSDHTAALPTQPSAPRAYTQPYQRITYQQVMLVHSDTNENPDDKRYSSSLNHGNNEPDDLQNKPLTTVSNGKSVVTSADVENVQDKEVPAHDTASTTPSHEGSSLITAQPISFELQCNQRTLVVGASGSGKSTLTKPLVDLHTSYTGTILLDDIDLSTITLKERARRIGYFAQSNHIFHASVRDNIALFDANMTDVDIMQACAHAHIDEWVRARGLDAIIDNSLDALSGGERQRLLLARLLVQKPQFCIFDELTTGLDAKTADLVEEYIWSHIPGFIYITHRLRPEIMQAADQIILMDHGAMVARGTYDEMKQHLQEYGLLVH